MSAVILPEMRPPGRRGFGIALPATATGGAAALVEGRVGPATAGPPLHIHPGSEETYYVLEGALVMYIGGEVTELKAGGVAYISRGTEHTWATPLDSDAHFLTLHTPGGYEEYHPAALQLEADLGRPPTTDDLFQLARRYDWKLAGTEVRRLLPTGTLIDASLADAVAAEARQAVAASP
ncbi:MAG TPA: cupin domain-containing protein [Streptosporangiaceae bacterium]|nr:cupin domain-containing protein [Streptosporangiaceae bacterium]